MRHSARHRARRRGFLRRRVLPRGGQRRSLTRRGAAAAVLTAGIGVLAVAGSSPAVATAHGPAAITPATTAAEVPRPAPSPVPARKPVVVSCARHRVVGPRALVITCADANDYLTRLRWVSWGSVAFGHGVAHVNDCTPYCAAGHVRTYQVLVTLWRAEPQAHQPGLRFTRLTELYTGQRPVEYTTAGRPYRPRTVTWHL